MPEPLFKQHALRLRIQAMNPDHPGNREMMTIESFDSFLDFVRSLPWRADNYWTEVYERIGLQSPK